MNSIVKSEKSNIELLIAFILFLLCVVMNCVADIFRGTVLFYIFYNTFFVLGLCVFSPLFFVSTILKQDLSSIGITHKNWLRAVVIGIFLLIVSLPGYIYSMLKMNFHIPSNKILFFTIICLIMSSIFEEVFFRGFLQSKFEKYYGMIPAIILSGICFSLYHVGYSDFRDFRTLITLFCVGVFFSISFRITKNIITSLVVNIPFALVTFIIKQRYFTARDSMFAFIIIIISVILIIMFLIKNTKEHPTTASTCQS